VKLVVGLGNPGKKYEGTRHNLGFLIVDRVAQQRRVELKTRLCDALVGEWLEDGQKIVLAKPQSFMNRSGVAVKDLLQVYGGAPEDLAIVYDDLDLPFGRIRIRPQGGAAGHRGVLSILENLAGAPFFRVRIGIGRPPEGEDPADYVLTPFEEDEAVELENIVQRAAEAVLSFVHDGPRRAMELYNRAS
jgi:peptidyl-tRNA hydrolase, PTH1 family